jgi:hypothetical protein
MRRRGLGFGGAVGLGVAVALIIAVIAIGRALAAQLEGAARTIIIFGEVTICAVLGAVALAALGLLAYGGMLGRIKIAERRLGLEQLARQVSAGQLEPGAPWAVHAEVLDGGQAPALDGRPAPAAIESSHACVSAHSQVYAQPHVVTSQAARPRCAHGGERRSLWRRAGSARIPAARRRVARRRLTSTRGGRGAAAAW